MMSKKMQVLSAMMLFQMNGTAALSIPTPPKAVSRKGFMENVLVGVASAVILPSIANADATNKVASSTAMRSVKRAQKQLPNMQFSAKDNDFSKVTEALRTSPFADVRRNCFIVVRGAEDGPKSEEIQAAYKTFIATVEQIDATAKLGARGRKIPPGQLFEEYLAIESSIDGFIKVGEEAMAIPLYTADAE
jgi:hypothetical protein